MPSRKLRACVRSLRQMTRSALPQAGTVARPGRTRATTRLPIKQAYFHSLVPTRNWGLQCNKLWRSAVRKVSDSYRRPKRAIRSKLGQRDLNGACTTSAAEATDADSGQRRQRNDEWEAKMDGAIKASIPWRNLSRSRRAWGVAGRGSTQQSAAEISTAYLMPHRRGGTGRCRRPPRRGFGGRSP